MITSGGHAQTLSENRSDSVNNLPAVAFAKSSLTVNEGTSTVDLMIELVKEGTKAVNIDVIFLPEESSADTSDIVYSTQTVRFDANNTSGDIKTVAVDIISDDIFEGDESAVFQLYNSTTGINIESQKLKVIITDDIPRIVFNEINARSLENDARKNALKTHKFIEWVNTSEQNFDISGWTLDDGTAKRFTFPSGAVIRAGQAVVLFEYDGKYQPPGNFGAANIYTTSDLGLNGSSQKLTLKDKTGTIITSAQLDKITAGESKNLSPEGSGRKYVDHSLLSGGTLSSPGTKVDGTSFGNGTYAMSFKGNEGWRLVSSPTQNTNFNNLFSNILIQSAAGSKTTPEANIYNWREPSGGALSVISDMNTVLVPGKGYMVYINEDDDFGTSGVQGSFPKTITTDKVENTSPVSIAVTSVDADGSAGIDGNEGYNLLGNPFGTDLSVAEILDALEASASSGTVNANISVWDPNRGGENGAFVNLTDGDRLSPFQAFFMRFTTDGVSANVSFDRSKLAVHQGTDFYKHPATSKAEFEMVLSNGDKFDTYKVEFSEAGTVGEDRYDAYKLFSLNPNSIGLYSTIGDNIKLAKNVLPDLESLEGELRIPLGFDLPKSGRYTFSWNNFKDLPDDMGVFIVDNETNRKTNLRLSEDLSFNSVISDLKTETSESDLSPDITGSNTRALPRFELLIIASKNTTGTNKELDKIVEVSPNYPNPFRSQTTMDLKLKEKMHVKMTIWNIVGQKIATICDEMMEEGEHPMTWNITANMPSGIYICKVEAGGKVLTRKMTLVK